MTQLVDSSTGPVADAPPSMLRRGVSLARRLPDLGIYVGVALIAAGFVLITVAWHLVSRHIVVAAQMPYIVSAAFPGIGLVICGVAAIAMTVKAKETAARRAQLHELLENQRQIRAALERAAVQTRKPSRPRARATSRSRGGER